MVENQNQFYISQTDLDTLIHPILYPQKCVPQSSIKLIALDAGHGGKDPGSMAGDETEKNHNLLLAKEVERRLQNAGLKTILTRSNDVFIPLEERPEIARKAKADLFVSLHYNSVADNEENTRGLEVFCLTPSGAVSTRTRSDENGHGSNPGNNSDRQNVLLGYQVHRSILNTLGGEDRGVRRGHLAVLRLASMPAVLVEGGFLSNEQEAKKIYSPKYRGQLAQAIVDGLLAYKRITERKPASPPPAKKVEPKKPDKKTAQPAKKQNAKGTLKEGSSKEAKPQNSSSPEKEKSSQPNKSKDTEENRPSNKEETTNPVPSYLIPITRPIGSNTTLINEPPPFLRWVKEGKTEYSKT